MYTSRSLNMISIYNDNLIEIRHNVESKCFDYTLKKFDSDAELRMAHEKLLEYVIKYKCDKLLGDITDQKAIIVSFQTWMLENWMPRVIKAGITIFAVVVKHQGVVDAGLKQMMRKTAVEFEKAGMKSVTFPDMDEARKWIASLKS
jgi:hypothetical protein